eukprot:m.84637 g.84637  ORF g.84637 m.84637 type:complete len:621 (-) comp12757_c0_seq2:1177-3039(-)
MATIRLDCVAIAAILLAVAVAERVQQPQRPNIVFLFADDLGYGDLGCYGHPTSDTPNIDKLASEGMKFLDFYTSSPVCSPSRAGLLTGRYQTRSGIYPGVFEPASTQGLPHNETTIANQLKSIGYNTAIVGKWHLGVGNVSQYLPTNFGFDQYTGIPYSHDMPDPADCFARGPTMENLPCFPGTPPDPMKTTTPFNMSQGTQTHSFHGLALPAVEPMQTLSATHPHQCRLACEQLQGCLIGEFTSRAHQCRLLNRSAPFQPDSDALLLFPSLKAYQTVAQMSHLTSNNEVSIPLYHYKGSNVSILQQPANLSTLDELYLDTALDFIDANAQNSTPFFLYFAFQHTHHPDYASTAFFNTTYRGMMGDSLNALDWSVGQVMAKLKALGIDDNTMVFFSSDNGPSLMRLERGGDAGPLRCGKGTTWEGGQRVPAIIRWPQRVQPGVSRDITSTLDMFPTISNILNISIPTDRYYDGIDMSPILFLQQTGTRSAFYYWPENVAAPTDLHAVRWHEWKMHLKTEGSHAPSNYFVPSCAAKLQVHDPPLLFNLYHDPGEHVPLDSTDPKFGFIIQKLHSLVEEHLASPGLFGTAQIGPSNPAYQPCCKPTCSQQHPKAMDTCCRTD